MHQSPGWEALGLSITNVSLPALFLEAVNVYLVSLVLQNTVFSFAPKQAVGDRGEGKFTLLLTP